MTDHDQQRPRRRWRAVPLAALAVLAASAGAVTASPGGDRAATSPGEAPAAFERVQQQQEPQEQRDRDCPREDGAAPGSGSGSGSGTSGGDAAATPEV